MRSNVRREEVTLEDTLRGLEEGMSLVERARGVLEEIGRIQGNVFGGGEGTGRLDREYSSNCLEYIKLGMVRLS